MPAQQEGHILAEPLFLKRKHAGNLLNAIRQPRFTLSKYKEENVILFSILLFREIFLKIKNKNDKNR